MMNDPTITVTCDGCGHDSEPMDLCSLAHGGWDARNIPKRLIREGWKQDGNRWICEDCQDKENPEAQS